MADEDKQGEEGKEVVTSSAGVPIVAPVQTTSGGTPGGGVEGEQSWKIKLLSELMYAIIAVLFVGFGTMFVAVAAMFVNAWTSKQASYDDLMIQVSQQNGQIQDLSNEICQMSKQKGLPCSN